MQAAESKSPSIMTDILLHAAVARIKNFNLHTGRQRESATERVMRFGPIWFQMDREGQVEIMYWSNVLFKRPVPHTEQRPRGSQRQSMGHKPTRPPPPAKADYSEPSTLAGEKHASSRICTGAGFTLIRSPGNPEIDFQALKI